MIIYIFDSSAVLRYLDDEAGANMVRSHLRACIAGRAAIRISAVQWGEITGRLRVRLGAARQEGVMGTLLPSEVEIVSITGERAVRAAELRIDRKIPYADAFAVELALDSPDRILVTADYDFKAVEDMIKIEFLKQK